MILQSINDLSPTEAIDLFRRLCGSTAWCERLASRRPFSDGKNLHQSADEVFDDLSETDWLEAFAFHPKIGDVDSLRMRFSGNKQWSAIEQSGMSQADEKMIRALAAGNQSYESRFGYIFIVCASGKSASEMLVLLNERLENNAANELVIAAREQRKISHLRIDKLLDSASQAPTNKSD